VNKIEKTNGIYILEAKLKGEKFNRNKHDIGIEVKAITYSFLNIDERKNGSIIDIVFDI